MSFYQFNRCTLVHVVDRDLTQPRRSASVNIHSETRSHDVPSNRDSTITILLLLDIAPRNTWTSTSKGERQKPHQHKRQHPGCDKTRSFRRENTPNTHRTDCMVHDIRSRKDPSIDPSILAGSQTDTLANTRQLQPGLPRRNTGFVTSLYCLYFVEMNDEQHPHHFKPRQKWIIINFLHRKSK